MIECISDARFGLLIKYGLKFLSLFKIARYILTRSVRSSNFILISKHAWEQTWTWIIVHHRQPCGFIFISYGLITRAQSRGLNELEIGRCGLPNEHSTHLNILLSTFKWCAIHDPLRSYRRNWRLWARSAMNNLLLLKYIFDNHFYLGLMVLYAN